jgi:hypothetical protein
MLMIVIQEHFHCVVRSRKASSFSSFGASHNNYCRTGSIVSYQPKRIIFLSCLGLPEFGGGRKILVRRRALGLIRGISMVDGFL